jgi:hypothetical protein
VPVLVFLVAAAYAGAAGETLTALLGTLPWHWTAVLVRGAVWGAAAAVLAGWLRWRAPEVLAVVCGPAAEAVLAVLSIVTALGVGAVAIRDPQPGGLALVFGALLFAVAGVAWGRAARHGLERTAGRSGTA